MLNETLYNAIKTLIEPLDIKLVEVYSSELKTPFIHISLGNTVFEEVPAEYLKSGIIKATKEFSIIVGNEFKRDIRSDGEKRRLMNAEIDSVTYKLLKANIKGQHEIKEKGVKQMDIRISRLELGTIYHYLDDVNSRYEALIDGTIFFAIYNF